ncbi:MAG: bifunctional adenosylcobinamide kinase/adenosylcobinamide-phosphate guanylyltransferase [Anaerolineaceae bacterium 4572_5.1]|nr:MAG: bifunctional adenosylcobinamide kinase/adenosylcobinamide-phosphate guanylyltransferase [Anaerolineaceae bacterium 4572_5.1]
MPPSTTLILGGARSGKSAYAEQLAAETGGRGRVLYVATATAEDPEMTARIEAHRQNRPSHWQTLEAPRDVGARLAAVKPRPDIILLDCLTLLVSNIVIAKENRAQEAIESVVQAEIEAILAARSKLNAALIIVSNEVGLGLVPPYPLGRLYRDILGRANRQLASRADKVLFMVAGLPMTVK